MPIRRTLLLIADIGGYTKYMKVERMNLSHAQDVVAQLLEAVIDGAGSRLKLSKLEGDAALFYASLPDRDDGTALAAVADQVAAIRRAFMARRDRMEIDRLCTCDGCTQVSQLKLKFVAHVGEVAFQKVKSFTELAGMDVILVHRMLKNTVPVSEYVLMTEPLHGALTEGLRAQAHPLTEDYEGVGPTAVHYLDLNEIAHTYPSKLRPSLLRAWWERIKMNVRAIPYFLGIKKPCDGFRNMGEVLSLPPPTGRDG